MADWNNEATEGLTLAKARHGIAIMRKHQIAADQIVVLRDWTAASAFVLWRAGELDRWEAWAILYNLGYRGRDLAPLYGVR